MKPNRPATAGAARRRRAIACLGAWLLSVAVCPFGQAATQQGKLAYLKSLSIEELLQTEVTIVSKKSEQLLDAAAAVFVLTQEDIRRSGARSIPEALRMVPGLQVAQIDANKWVVGARGFADRFSNKLLVLMDGRSLYTPLFSGVYWDVQDTLLEDIERIEVIRGPGATVWGANAVNGVINIITQSARDTQGVLLSAGAGSHETALDGLRYGGRIGDDTFYRLYAKGFIRDDFDSPDGGRAHDAWQSIRSGFRLETAPTFRDTLTFQGDIYQQDADQTINFTSFLVPPFARTLEDEIDASGMNLIARWKQQSSERANWMLQVYYDRTDRQEVIIDEARDTFDAEYQHQWTLNDRHDLVWGLGYRYTSDDTEGAFNTAMDPENRDDHLFSAFFQDDIMLVGDQVWLTLGTKLEHNDYSGFEIQPSARLRWKPTAQSTLWSSVSRAVRTPSRADQDLAVNLSARQDPASGMLSVLRVSGNPDFESEALTALEVGYRWASGSVFSLDVTAFYTIYDKYRSLEPQVPFLEVTPQPPHLVIPLLIDNRMDAETHGVEALVTWQPLDFWRLSAGYSYLNIKMNPDDTSRDTESEEYEGFSPDHQVQLRSYLDLPKDFSLDALVYLVDKIHHWEIDSYARLDLRLGWDPGPNWSFSLMASNLLDSGHPEFGDISGIKASEVPRAIFGKLTWRF